MRNFWDEKNILVTTNGVPAKQPFSESNFTRFTLRCDETRVFGPETPLDSNGIIIHST